MPRKTKHKTYRNEPPPIAQQQDRTALFDETGRKITRKEDKGVWAAIYAKRRKP